MKSNVFHVEQRGELFVIVSPDDKVCGVGETIDCTGRDGIPYGTMTAGPQTLLFYSFDEANDYMQGGFYPTVLDLAREAEAEYTEDWYD